MGIMRIFARTIENYKVRKRMIAESYDLVLWELYNKLREAKYVLFIRYGD